MIDIFDIFEKKKIETSNFGVFDILAIIIDYEYPRCFIASNNGGYYAFMECEDNNLKYGWTVSKVSTLQIHDVNLGIKNVQSLFHKEQCFEVMFKKDSNCAKAINYGSVEEKHLITGNLFVKDFCDMDETFDYHSLQKTALSEQRNSISIIYESEKTGKTGFVYKTINYLKEMFRNIKNPIDIMESSFSTQNLSTVITFTFDRDINLSQNSTTPELEPLYTDSFRQIGNILSSDDPSELISETSKPEKFLGKYENIFKTINSEDDLRPKIVMASSSFEKAKSFDMSKRIEQEKSLVIMSAKKMIKENTIVKEDIKTIKGVLEGIFPSKNGRFVFKERGGLERVFDGRVDVALLDKIHSFVVKGAIYDATIKVLSAVQGERLIKESSILLSLDFVEEIKQNKQLNLLNNN